MNFRALDACVGPADDHKNGNVYGKDVDLQTVDRVLVRTMPAGSLEQIIYRMDVLHSLAAAGVPVLNPPRALEAAIDKYLSLSRIAAAGLPVPSTRVSESAASALVSFEELGGDVVTKPLFGSEGQRLCRMTHPSDAAEHFRQLEEAGEVIYQQMFVDHPGWDFRVLVVGEEVVGSMKRTAADGWITNVARGGRAERTILPVEAHDLALRATRAVGAEVAGVDLVPDRHGNLWVLEANAVPGWRALGNVEDRDFAALILRYLIDRSPN